MKSIKSIRLLIVIASLCMFACSNPAPVEPQSEETPTAEAEKTVTRVPELIGLTHEEAQNLLFEADLAEKNSYTFNESFGEGIVFETNPPAGNVVNKGSSVWLNISKGPEPTPEPTPEMLTTTFIIPDGLVGMPTEDVVKKLTEMGIRVKVTTVDIIAMVGYENAPNISPIGIVEDVIPSEGGEYIQYDDGDNCVVIVCYEP